MDGLLNEYAYATARGEKNYRIHVPFLLTHDTTLRRHWKKNVYEYSASISIPFTIQQNSIDMHVISRLYTKWRAIYLFSQHLGCDNQVIGIIWCEVTRPITF